MCSFIKGGTAKTYPLIEKDAVGDGTKPQRAWTYGL